MENLTLVERAQALEDGKQLQFLANNIQGNGFIDWNPKSISINIFFDKDWIFRIKPEPVVVYGHEIEGIDPPLERVANIHTPVFILDGNQAKGYVKTSAYNAETAIKRKIAWAKKEDIQKVVKCLGWVE